MPVNAAWITICICTALSLLLFPKSVSATPTLLFDATKAESAGNADWVIDADVHNVSYSTGPAVIGSGGTESNPQQIPTPAASGITASTSETYWTGALSSWGVSLVKKGDGVQTLPIGGSITYGNSGNAQDLSHYSAYVLDEPSISFTATEKTAILTYVQNGGGLILISDHGSSDRNNDGVDSVQVLNDLMTNNAVKTNPFGVTWNADDDSGTFTSLDAAAADPIIKGANGAVSSFVYNDGSTMTLSSASNSSVKGAIFYTSAKSVSSAVVAYGTFGAGRFVVIGDSSPEDDGTGDPNDTLYDGWTSGSDAAVLLNASDYVVPEPSIAIISLGVACLFHRDRRKSIGSSARPLTP